jgi:opacity protein-like surface antigen
MTRFPLPAALAAALALGLAIPAAAQTGVYVRGGLSLDWSRDTRSTDRECGATAPPALFGCGIGIDGQPLSASGDFGFPIGLEGGVGYRLAPMFRVEGLLTYRRGTEFEGEANFIGTPPPQPVTGRLDTFTGMAVAYLDFPGFGVPMLAGPLEPFVGLGVGLSHHDLGSVTYAFPGLSPEASTVLSGGTRTSLSYMLTAGVAARLSPQLTIDLAYRYTDLGTVGTDEGPAVITRRTFTRTLDIAETEADLTTHGLSASVRFGF